MELQDGTPETNVRAISLRRSRRKASGTDTVSRGNDVLQRAAGRVRDAAGQALDPPRQAVRALLGLSSILVKGTVSAWETCVGEGTDVEASIRARLTRALRNVPSSLPTSWR